MSYSAPSHWARLQGKTQVVHSRPQKAEIEFSPAVSFFLSALPLFPSSSSFQPLTFLNQVSLGLQLCIVHTVLCLVLHGVVSEEILQRQPWRTHSCIRKEGYQGLCGNSRYGQYEQMQYGQNMSDTDAFLLTQGLISTVPQGYWSI